VYLRFVFAEAEPTTRRRVGILRNQETLGGRSRVAGEIFDWLNCHLPFPPKPAFSAGRGLCWFKLEARDAVEKMRDLSFLLERRGERIWQIYSRNPGLITYEDEFQIVAVPESAIRLTSAPTRFGR